VIAIGVFAAAILAGGGSLFALSLLEDKFAFHPSRVVEMTPQAVGLAFEDVRLATPDGQALAGWWLPGEPGAPAILFMHGNAGNISHRLHTLALLRQAGFAILIFDYRGYGDSTGAPSEEGLYEDARAAWDHVTRERSFAPGRVVLYGESIGTAPALNLAHELAAAGRPGPGALVLEGAFTSALEMGRRIFPFLPLKLILKMKMENREAIKDVTAPTLFIHGAEDEIVPLRMGRELFAGSPAEMKEFAEVPQAMHNSVWMLGGEEVRNVVEDFVGRAIPAS